MRRRTVVGTLACVCVLTSCTSNGYQPGEGTGVDPSSLYRAPSSAASASPSASSTAGPEPSSSPGALPILNDPDTIPLSREISRVAVTPSELLNMRTPEEQLVLDTARHLVIKKCMADQGFDYLWPDLKALSKQPHAAVYDFTIGIVNPEYSWRYGYQMNSAELSYQVEKPRESPSSEYEHAMMVGSDGWGCWGEGERALDRDLPPGEIPGGERQEKAWKILRTIEQDAEAAALADDRYKAALADWASCIRAAGYTYTSPAEAAEAFDAFTTAEETPPSPPEDELNTARADLECKRSSRLAAVYQQLLWDNQTAMMEKNQPAFTIIDELDDRVLRTAQEIIKELG
ncbi:MAG: hypothetical protein QM713_11110 [Arachnia sp.]